MQQNAQQNVGAPSSAATSTTGANAGQIGTSAAPSKKPASGGDAFASLLSGSGIKKTGSPAQKGLTIADMAKQKAQAGLYGANAQPMAFQQPQGARKPGAGTGGSGLDDLLG